MRSGHGKKLDYAVFEGKKKELKGKSDLIEGLTFLTKKYNVEDEVVAELKRKGKWY